MFKDHDKFVELSLNEEELISGGFVRRLFRSARRIATSRKTWNTIGYTVGGALAALALITMGGSPYAKGDGSGIKEMGGTWGEKF